MSSFSKRRSVVGDEKKTLGEGVFRKCDECQATLQAGEFAENFEVCPTCEKHYPLRAERWVELLLDEDSFEESHQALRSVDALAFHDSKPYPVRLSAAEKKMGPRDALLSGGGKLKGRAVQLGVFQFGFMGGSMGSVVGEKVCRLFESGLERREPVIVLSASGGARMQEGALALMQMAKSVSALGRLRDAGVPFISLLLHPTTGGVAASFSLLGDVNLAEPGALIGFAGPRVIEQTIGETLPEGFQRSEFLLEHGMIDRIVSRHRMRDEIALVLSHLLD